jgi:LPS sulfotransferase NodH
VRLIQDMSNVPPPLGSEHDTEPARDSSSPSRCYIVCSTQRSGSGLLCRGLTGARVAGTPTEYFNPDNRAALATRWGCGPDLGAYVAALRSRRSAPTGVFGAKLHWDQFQQLRAEALGVSCAEPEFEISARFLEDLFAAPLYVHILRRDVNRQAISFWTALRTGVWSQSTVAAGQPPEIPYSFEGIERCRRLIENAELHWDRFFRFNDIEPLHVVYEDLVASYEQTIGALLGAVLPELDDVRVRAPESRRLGNERSDALLELFARDREMRGLDDPRATAVETDGRLSPEDQLANLQSSRSWRLTRPLRAMSERLALTRAA